jgi:hypothetical protein
MVRAGGASTPHRDGSPESTVTRVVDVHMLLKKELEATELTWCAQERDLQERFAVLTRIGVGTKSRVACDVAGSSHTCQWRGVVSLLLCRRAVRNKHSLSRNPQRIRFL